MDVELEKPKFWLLIGLIGSGKTTFSRKLWETNPQGTIRVCLDEIIQMMSFYNYHLELKPLYGAFERIPIIKGLSLGYNIVIDRTNLTKEIRSYFIGIPTKIREIAGQMFRIVKSEESGLFSENKTKLLLALTSYLDSLEASGVDKDIVDAMREMAEKKLEENKELSLFGRKDETTLADHLNRLRNIQIIGVFFDVPPDLCLKRRLEDPLNKLREQTREVDWKAVLDKMLLMMEKPSLDEGFDRIIYVDENGGIKNVETKNTSS